jgi:hypothetical protein
MQLAAHWQRCQNLQKTSEDFLQQDTGGEMILSRREAKLIEFASGISEKDMIDCEDQ